MWVKMANLDNGVFYVGSFEGLLTVNENVGPKKKADYYAGYLMDGCAFLLETKWLRPTPVRVTQDTIGKQRFDVIETRLTHLNEYQDWRMDYYVDPESLVVKGVASYPAAGNRSHFIRFGGYTTVDGLSVPTKMATTFKVEEPKKSAYTPLTFRFNVDYDPKIFEHPPSVEAGPDAWKSKK